MREKWLNDAVKALRKLFKSHGHTLPRTILVSVGFPSGGYRSSTVAECWSPDLSSGKMQIFISPTVHNSVEVLTILAHELIHATLNNEGGHGHKYQRIAKQIGLISPWVEAKAGKNLTDEFCELAKKLGKYPHPEFTAAESTYNRQVARLLKIWCEPCDYVLRGTRKQINRGLPDCPVCGGKLEVEDGKSKLRGKGSASDDPA